MGRMGTAKQYKISTLQQLLETLLYSVFALIHKHTPCDFPVATLPETSGRKDCACSLRLFVENYLPHSIEIALRNNSLQEQSRRPLHIAGRLVTEIIPDVICDMMNGNESDQTF